MASISSVSAAGLEHVPRAAGLEQRQQILRFGVHGQDQHLGFEAALANRARRVQAAHARHLDVHDDDVRLGRARGVDRGRAVRRLADDLDVRLGVEQGLEPGRRTA